MSHHVDIANLSVKRSRGRETKTVLRGLTLRVPSGSVTVIMGESGSGKTTLLRAVAGLEEAFEGSILFDGKDVTAHAPGRRDVAMAFQSYALYPGLSVERNLELPLEAQAATNGTRPERGLRQQRVEEMLRRLGILSLRRRDVRCISGGEQQRVALGRALIRRPRVLLLDEPLSNVDPSRRQGIVELLRELIAEHRVTTLLVTHDWEEASLLGDRIAVLDGGVVIQVGSPHEIYHAPASLKVLSFSQQGLLNRFDGLQPSEDGRTLEGSGALRVRTSRSLPAGAYTAVFRADHLRVAPGGFGARLVATRPSAGLFHLELEAAGYRLFGSMSGPRPPARGSELRVAAEAGAGWIADGEGRFVARLESLEVGP